MSFEGAPSAPLEGPWQAISGEWTVGTDRLRGRPFTVPLPVGIAQHATLVGVTGSGKTTTAEQLAQAALGRGLGVLIVDAKGGGLRRAARVMAADRGEPYAELVPGAPGSLGYNPCAAGSRSQVADKLVSAFAHGPNAEIYRVIAQEAIAVVVGVLWALGEPVTVRRLRQELDRARMAGLAHRARDVAPQLAADLADLGKRGGVSGEALDGMRARLGALLQGEYGELFEREGEQLDLQEALARAGVTYVSLPALAVTKDTALMARVLIQDLKQAAHRRLQEAAAPPALLVLDEFAALDDPEQVGDLLRQAREARVAALVSTPAGPGHRVRAPRCAARRRAADRPPLRRGGCRGHRRRHRHGEGRGGNPPDRGRRQHRARLGAPGRPLHRQPQRDQTAGHRRGCGPGHGGRAARRHRAGDGAIHAVGRAAMTDPKPARPPTPPTTSTAATEPLVEQLSRGRPAYYPSAWRWLAVGVRRQSPAAVVALVTAWSGLWALLTLATVFLAGAALIAFIAWLIGGGIGGVAGLVAALGITAGTIAGFIGALFLSGPGVVISVAAGTLLSLLFFGVLVAAEPWTLQLRGYRRMSRREYDRLVPLLLESARLMHLGSLPTVLIADDGSRNAYTAVRHIVISRTLLDELQDEPLAGVLTHELHHWAQADSVGLRFVFAAALPLALLYNLAVLLVRFRGLVALIALVLLWPAYALTKLVIEPLVADRSRGQEYEADQAARAAGYGDALREALTHLGEFEGGRSGWEQVITATHPPIELRLEALE